VNGKSNGHGGTALPEPVMVKEEQGPVKQELCKQIY